MHKLGFMGSFLTNSSSVTLYNALQTAHSKVKTTPTTDPSAVKLEIAVRISPTNKMTNPTNCGKSKASRNYLKPIEKSATKIVEELLSIVKMETGKR
jgi:hypothetical protein